MHSQPTPFFPPRNCKFGPLLTVRSLALMAVFAASVMLSSDSVAQTFSGANNLRIDRTLNGSNNNAGNNKEVFMENKFFSLGMSSIGSFGSANNAPAGFHPVNPPRLSIGLAADQDGYDTGNAPLTGDWFLPGTPAEALIVGYTDGGATQHAFANAERVAFFQISGNNVTSVDTSQAASKGIIQGIWSGTTSDGVLRVTTTHDMRSTNTFFQTRVRLQNLSGSQIFNVRYGRNFDPDQDRDLNTGLGTSFTTTNTIVENFPANNRAVVKATGVVTGQPILLMTFDTRGRAFYHFANTLAEGNPYTARVYDSVPGTGTSSVADTAIGLTFDVGTLAAAGNAGDFVELEYYTTIDPNLDNALQGIVDVYKTPTPPEYTADTKSGLSTPTAVIAADMRSVGRQRDIVVANENNDTVSVMISDDFGSLGPPTSYSLNAGDNPVHMAAGLFNVGFSADVVVASPGNNRVTFLPNNGSSGFGTRTDLTVGNNPVYVSAIDLDGDFISEVFVAQKDDGNVRVLKHTGAAGTVYASQGVFTSGSGGGGSQVSSVVPVKYGSTFYLATANQNDDTISVLKYSTGTTFGSLANFSVTGAGANPEPIQALAGDLNGDNIPDVAVLNGNTANVTVFLGSGATNAWTLTVDESYAAGTGPTRMHMRDLNNDGYLDLAIAATAGGAIRVLSGVGDGTFVFSSSTSVGANNPVDVVATDGDWNFQQDLYVALTGTDELGLLTFNSTYALSQTYNASEDILTQIDLIGVDPNGGGNLEFVIQEVPTNGTLTKSNTVTTVTSSMVKGDSFKKATEVVLYRGNTNYNGSDSFDFYAIGSGRLSAIQTATINVRPINDQPSFDITGAPPINVNEDSGLTEIANFVGNYNLGPADESSQQILKFTVTSDNTGLFQSQPTIVDVANGTLRFQPKLDQSGTANVSIQAVDNGGVNYGGNHTSVAKNFVINVAAVDDPPSITAPGTFYLNEDSGVQNLDFTVTDAETASGSLTVTATSGDTSIVANPLTATFQSGSTWRVPITPVANAFGLVTITINATDGTTPVQNDVTVNVLPVNDKPSFGLSQTTINVNEDSGQVVMAGFVTSPSAGPANESAQAVFYTLSNDNNPLFSFQPNIIDRNNGTLKFTPAANANGSATVDIFAKDTGGTSRGGVNQSTPTLQFTINVAAVDDAPTITATANLIIDEDSGTTNFDFDVFDPETASGSLTVTAVSSDANVIPNPVTPVFQSGTTWRIPLTPEANANGLITITITATDGTTPSVHVLNLNVRSVNDKPSFAISVGPGGDVPVNEDAGYVEVNNFITSPSTGPANESDQSLFYHVSNDNNALFSFQPVISDRVNGVLRFRPANDAFGVANVTIYATDNGGVASGGVNTSSPVINFTITVASVNDGPEISGVSVVNVDEDSGTTNLDFEVTDAETASNALTVTAVSGTPGTIPNPTPVFISGNTWRVPVTPVANQFGQVTVTINATDGTTPSNKAVIVNVRAVNDQPSFSLSTGTININEDAGTQTIMNFVPLPGIDFGAGGDANEAGQSATFLITGNSNPGLFQFVPKINAAGTLQFRTALNANGSATIDVKLRDNGGVNYGGVNESTVKQFTINVAAVEDTPTILNRGIDLLLENASGDWNFDVSDGETTAASLTINFGNTNTTLFPPGSIVLGGANENRKLTFTPAADRFGRDKITVTVTDGSANSVQLIRNIVVQNINTAPTFDLAKTSASTARSDAPSTTSIPNFTENVVTGPGDESSQAVTYLVSNDNNALFAQQPAITTAGQLNFRPVSGQEGVATVTVQGRDNGGTAYGGDNLSATKQFKIYVCGFDDGDIVVGDANAVWLVSQAGVALLVTDQIANPQGVAWDATNQRILVVDPTASGTGVASAIASTDSMAVTTISSGQFFAAPGRIGVSTNGTTIYVADGPNLITVNPSTGSQSVGLVLNDILDFSVRGDGTIDLLNDNGGSIQAANVDPQASFAVTPIGPSRPFGNSLAFNELLTGGELLFQFVSTDPKVFVALVNPLVFLEMAPAPSTGHSMRTDGLDSFHTISVGGTPTIMKVSGLTGPGSVVFSGAPFTDLRGLDIVEPVPAP